MISAKKSASMTPEKMTGARQLEILSGPASATGSIPCPGAATSKFALPMTPPKAPTPASSRGRMVSSIATNPRVSPISQAVSAVAADWGQVGSWAQIEWTSVEAKTMSSASVRHAMRAAATIPDQNPARAPSRAFPVGRAAAAPANAVKQRSASTLSGRSTAPAAGSQIATRVMVRTATPKARPDSTPGRQVRVDGMLVENTHK